MEDVPSEPTLNPFQVVSVCIGAGLSDCYEASLPGSVVPDVVLPDKFEPGQEHVDAEINNQPFYFERLPTELQGLVVNLAPGETLKVLNLVSRSLHKLVSDSEKFKKYSDFINCHQKDFKKLAALKHKACCLFAIGCILLAVELGLVATFVVLRVFSSNDFLRGLGLGVLGLAISPEILLCVLRCFGCNVSVSEKGDRRFLSLAIGHLIDAFKKIKAYKVFQKKLLHDMYLSQFGGETV